MSLTALSSLRNHFLIAMPHLRDRNFEGSMTYVCEHSEQGAMGIVINRPTEVTVAEMLSQLEIEGDPLDVPVYSGGPLQNERGFVLHGPDTGWQSTLQIAEEIYVTTSRDILAALAAGEGPEEVLVALGYAGWAEGQLEQEISENVWLICDADRGILFEPDPSRKIDMALGRIGVNYSLLARDAGHG